MKITFSRVETRRRRAAYLAVATSASLSLALASCAATPTDDGDGAEQRSPITIAYTTTGATTAAEMLIGSDPSMCEDLGIDVKTELIAATVAASAVLSGQVDLARLGAGGFLQAATKSPEAIVAVAGTAAIPNVIYVSADVASPADLAGATVGASAPGSISDLVTKEWLRAEGIDPSTVEFTYAGTTSSVVGLASSGTIKAFAGTPPLPEAALNQGIKPMAELPGENPTINAISMGVQATSRIIFEREPAKIEAGLKCIARAQEMLRDDPESGVAVLAEAANLSDEAALEAIKIQFPSYELVQFTASDAQAVIDVLEEYGIQDFGDFDPAGSIDTSYLP